MADFGDEDKQTDRPYEILKLLQKSLLYQAQWLMLQTEMDHAKSKLSSLSKTGRATKQVSMFHLLKSPRQDCKDYAKQGPHSEVATSQKTSLTKASTPSKWEAVKGLDGIKSDLWEAVTGPEDFPNLYMNGEEVRNGVLLYGTPVTGKTFLAEALAAETGRSFVKIGNSQIFGKYMGESEKGMKDVFRKAKEAAPSILFFDEVDALCGLRRESDNTTTTSVKNIFLSEMTALATAGAKVLVLATTNHPHRLDDAAMRRFEKVMRLGWISSRRV